MWTNIFGAYEKAAIGFSVAAFRLAEKSAFSCRAIF